MLKLQIKDSGAWRNVLSFPGERREQVQVAAANLLEVGGAGRSAMRLVDGDTVVASCEQPACQWVPR